VFLLKKENTMCFDDIWMEKRQYSGYSLYLECKRDDNTLVCTHTNVITDEKLESGMRIRLINSDVMWTIKGCTFHADMDKNSWKIPEDVGYTVERKPGRVYDW
jgi:hypothetical protein